MDADFTGVIAGIPLLRPVRVADHPDEAVQVPTTRLYRQVTTSRYRLKLSFLHLVRLNRTHLRVYDSRAT